MAEPLVSGESSASVVAAVPLPHRLVTGFIGLNAGFVAVLGLAAPVALDRNFTWAELPPLHARFVGALYLFGTVFLFCSLLCRRWSSVAPTMVAIAIFTTSMLVLTLLNLDAFDLSLTPAVVWLIAYTLFPLLSWGLAITYRNHRPSELSAPGHLTVTVVAQRLLAVGFGVLGVAMLVGRSAVADAWPWAVSDGVVQFYGGPFLTLAWCAWAYSRRSAPEALRLYGGAMAVLGVAVLAVSLNHRALFDAAEPSAWLWFAVFGLVTVGGAALLVRATSLGAVTTSPRSRCATGEAGYRVR